MPEWKVAEYGNTDNIAAGHQDSKRATLLVWKKRDNLANVRICFCFQPTLPSKAILERSHTETEPLVKKAVAAIEVRSSKFEALKYMTVRQKQRDTGDKSDARRPASQ